MKLKYEFAIEELGESYVAVAVGDGSDSFRGVIKLNKTGKAIFELLKEETTAEGIITALEAKYEGVDKASVESLLEQLSRKGLLV